MAPGRRIFIGNIPSDSHEDDLVKFCKGYGHIREVVVKISEFQPSYGFVEYEESRNAKDAIYELNGKDLRGKRVRVQHARDRPDPSDRERDHRGNGHGRFHDRGGRSSDGGRCTRGNVPGPKSDHRLVVENLTDRTTWQDLKEEEMESNDKKEADAPKETNSCKDELKEKLTKNNQPNLVPETKKIIENLINNQIKAMLDKATMKAQEPDVLKALIEKATMEADKPNVLINPDVATETKLEDQPELKNNRFEDLVDKTITKAEDLIAQLKSESFQFQGFKKHHGLLLFTPEQIHDYTMRVVDRAMELRGADPNQVWKEFSKYFT